MLELILGLLVGLPIVFAARKIVSLKMAMLGFHAESRKRFYESAEQILTWEDISEERLTALLKMSEQLESRRVQLIVHQAVKELVAEGSAATRGATNPMTDGLPPEKRALWLQTYFSWMMAVSSQGSVIGATVLMDVMKYFSPESAAEKAEIIVSRHTREAHAH